MIFFYKNGFFDLGTVIDVLYMKHTVDADTLGRVISTSLEVCQHMDHDTLYLAIGEGRHILLEGQDAANFMQVISHDEVDIQGDVPPDVRHMRDKWLRTDIVDENVVSADINTAYPTVLKTSLLSKYGYSPSLDENPLLREDVSTSYTQVAKEAFPQFASLVDDFQTVKHDENPLSLDSRENAMDIEERRGMQSTGGDFN